MKCAGLIMRLWPGASTALLAFAADAGAFAALRGQDVGMAGVGVAPGEIVLQAAGQHGVIRDGPSRP